MSVTDPLRRRLLLAAVVVAGLVCLAGCSSGRSEFGTAILITRASERLEEVGSPADLTQCLTAELSETLTSKDAERLYGDISSEPVASERALRIVSGGFRPVREGIRRRVPACRRELVGPDGFSRFEFRHLLTRIGSRVFRDRSYLLG